MKKIGISLVLVLLLAGWVPTAFAVPAAKFSIHGDLSHRLQLTNRADFLKTDSSTNLPELNDGSVDEFFADIKYRMWVEAATKDGNVKGVVGTEIGSLRFGSGRMPYSGDQRRFEVRWAYMDFQLPTVGRKARFKIGLQPFSVNRYLWQETVGGVAYDSDAGDNLSYRLAWMRGEEWNKTGQSSDQDDKRTDVDSFLARFDYKPSGTLKGGAFLLYQKHDADGETHGNGSLDSFDWEIKKFGEEIGISLMSLGLDGTANINKFFVKWDLIYQLGKIKDTDFTEFASGTGQSGDFDLNAYFVHLDVGTNIDKFTITYTFWYASGDDNPTDDEFGAYIATDVDIDDSISLFEGNYADDNYFTERPYIADKGFIMNKLGVDYKASKKLTLGAALLYMFTAQDFEYTAAATGEDVSSNELGLEFGVYCKYKLYKNVEVAWNAGYLMAGDALDVYEVPSIQDGNSDQDIYITSAFVRYKF
ncbi:MAG: hypothetical protein GY874_14130 [Desulfobacteraceae bacterium]|nr:hypothetical protein [Desulfobacteraceae bacterium]